MVIDITMPRRLTKETMTDMLRKALAEAASSGQSIRSIARATGLKHPALLKFLRGDQSLRLDLADKLAAYLGIEVKRKGK